MAITFTRTLQAYTLDELKDNHPDAYQKALQTLTEIAWEFYDPEEISQDVADYTMGECHGFTVGVRTEHGYGGYTKEGKWSANKEWTRTRPDLFWGDYALGFNGSVADLEKKIREYRKAGKLSRAEADMLISMHAEGSIYFAFKMINGNEPSTELYSEYHPFIDTPLRQERVDKLQALLEEELKEACEQGLESAHQQRDATTEEETLIDLAEANGYTFDLGGKLCGPREGDKVVEGAAQ